MSDGMMLNLTDQLFDPTDGPPDLPPDLTYEDEPEELAHYIVQLHRPPTRVDREHLHDAHHLSLTQYVPTNGYIERVLPRRLDRLRADELVRAVVRYEPAFKIARDIGRHEFRTDDRRDEPGILVWVVLFPTASTRDVANAISALGVDVGGIVDDRERGGGARIRVRLEGDSLIAALARIEDVQAIEEVGEIVEDNVNAATTNQSGTAGTGPVWTAGLNGQGQIVGVIDSAPPDVNHCFFMDPVDNTPGFAHRKIIDIRNTSGGTAGGHATFVAGCVAGDDVNNPGTAARRGGAWAARLVCGNAGDLSLYGGTASLFSELSDAAAMGAVIHTNSWHENNTDSSNQANYTQTAIDADNFMWLNEDHLILGSSGNTGEEQGAPGTAKNAICVSAAQADPNENTLGDGNAGPTADGRRKPDLVGVGCSIQSATVGTNCATGPRSTCATSYATPHIAAAAALVRQYLTEGWYPTGAPDPHRGFTPSGALLKAMLVNSTRDMTGVAANIPNNTEGWGIVRLDDVLPFPGDALDLRVWDVRNADGLSTGDSVDHHVDVAFNTQRLRVTLVWTDPPSASMATTPLVNDLDLVVTSPDGTQSFLGNVFAGGTSTTGGTADRTENVENVLIATPAPGDWTLTVTANQVNVGNPGQGYALVVTADLEDAPSTLGDQDTLVVRAKFSDVAYEPPLPNLQNLMDDVAAYIDEVSYGQASITPRYRGPVALDHPRSYYSHPSRNLLVELVEEVVAKLVAAEPDVFDGPTGDPADDIDRLVIVTNDSSFTGDWATTGPWPYSLPAGFSRPISASVQSYTNDAARFTHGLLHQFGLVDLYAHPGVVFPRPYVDEWDNMSDLFLNVHPLVWSKERAGWVSAHGSSIEFIPRPAAGSSYTGTNPIRLFAQESTTTNRKAVALGLTAGVAGLAQENAFYVIEVRDNTLGGFDDALPDQGVLVYYVNELVPQGQGPVIVRDDNLLTTSLADAPLDVGDILSIPGTGITIEVLAGTAGADYDIQLTYEPPVTDYNIRITRGDTIDGRFYSYFSPDVWIDSPRGGFDLAAGPPAHGDRDDPVIGQLNRIYARVWNDGPATAYDFDVRFRISEPYHTVGGEADFDTFVGIAHVDSLAPGASTNVYVEWTPVDDGEAHACLLVDLINLVGTDTNPNDHEAQENLTKVTSVTSSPFHPVMHQYDLSNPYDEPALFYFRADGAPPGWTVDLSPRKIRLQPGERMEGQATITPPPDAEVCTSELIEVTSWTPRGDTLINVGGAIVQVDLRRPTVLTLDAGAAPCREEDLKLLLEKLREEGVDPQRMEQVLTHLLRAQGRDEDDTAATAARVLYEEAATRGETIPAATVLRDWENLLGPLVLKPKGRTEQPPRGEPEDPRDIFRSCGRITAKGCTDPPQPHTEIVVTFTGPTGEVEYHTVVTDEHGCFEAMTVTVDDGAWTVQAEFPGGACEAPTRSRPRVVQPCRCEGEHTHN